MLLDKLPLLSADADWTWDAAAGVFTLHASRAAVAPVAGGGSLTTSGGLYMDLTAANDWGISRPVHHPRSPKAPPPRGRS